MNPICDLLEPLVKDRYAVFDDLIDNKRKICWGEPKQASIKDFFKAFQ